MEGRQQTGRCDEQQRNHFIPLWEAERITLRNKREAGCITLGPLWGLFLQLSINGSLRDTLSEKNLLTHHCPINRRSWVEGGDEESKVIRWDGQALGKSMMATAQALMLMNLFIPSVCRRHTVFQLLHYFWEFSHFYPVSFGNHMSTHYLI